MLLAVELTRAEGYISLAVIGIDSQVAIQATGFMKGDSGQRLLDKL